MINTLTYTDILIIGAVPLIVGYVILGIFTRPLLNFITTELESPDTNLKNEVVKADAKLDVIKNKQNFKLLILELVKNIGVIFLGIVLIWKAIYQVLWISLLIFTPYYLIAIGMAGLVTLQFLVPASMGKKVFYRRIDALTYSAILSSLVFYHFFIL